MFTLHSSFYNYAIFSFLASYDIKYMANHFYYHLSDVKPLKAGIFCEAGIHYVGQSLWTYFFIWVSV